MAFNVGESVHQLSQELSAMALKVPAISFWESRAAWSYAPSTLGRDHSNHTNSFFFYSMDFHGVQKLFIQEHHHLLSELLRESDGVSTSSSFEQIHQAKVMLN